jgi:hypothetical protein
MPTSKKRGGKKAHNKRVAKRNVNSAAAQRQYEKIFTKMMEQQLNRINPEEDNA